MSDHLTVPTNEPESLAERGRELWTVLMCALVALISATDYETNAKIQDAKARIDAVLADVDAGEPSEATRVCYEAYQVVGSLLSDLGKFDTPEAEKILDNLSSARLVHKDVLPWDSYEPSQDSPPYAKDEPK